LRAEIIASRFFWGNRSNTASRRRSAYGPEVVSALKAIWRAAGYPWSVRLKALIPLWMPWVRKHFHLHAEVEYQLPAISARQIDRRLRPYKASAPRHLYGGTRPVRLLKHHIPLRVDRWDARAPGFTEVDLVAHSGSSGEFAYTLNVTDVYSGWRESRAVLGRGRAGVVAALEEIAQALPFRLLGIDTDNGSEFLNWHVGRWCAQRGIQFTRGRPYKKDDNAHIEQKNWTHVRKLLHDHLDFAVADLVRRAQIYGRIQPLLFRKHPQLLGDGTGPFGRLDRAAIEQIRRRVEEQRADATSVLTALHKFDSVDFSGYFDIKRGQRTAAEEIMEMFAKAVLAVFWFHRFESFLEAWSGDIEQ
jgi:hypothetical protein